MKNANRHDIGSYTCELENGIGMGISENDIDVDVRCKFLFSSRICMPVRNRIHQLLNYTLQMPRSSN